MRFDRVACAGNYRSNNKLTSRLRVNSSCKSPLSEKPYDAARGAVQRAASLKAKNTTDPLIASPCPQRKNSGPSPAFTIEPAAAEGQTKGARDRMALCTAAQPHRSTTANIINRLDAYPFTWAPSQTADNAGGPALVGADDSNGRVVP